MNDLRPNLKYATSSVGLLEVVIEKDPVAKVTSNLRPCFWNGDFKTLLECVLGGIALPQ